MPGRGAAPGVRLVPNSQTEAPAGAPLQWDTWDAIVDWLQVVPIETFEIGALPGLIFTARGDVAVIARALDGARVLASRRGDRHLIAGRCGGVPVLALAAQGRVAVATDERRRATAMERLAERGVTV